MDSFFELVFSDRVLSETGDTQVCCPFPHHTHDGNEYYETRPSAGVNISKGVFHCFSCNASLSEVGFISKYMGLSYADANKFKLMLAERENFTDWVITGHEELKKNQEIKNKIKTLHISDQVVDELKLGAVRPNSIDFPVSIFGKIVDVVSYRPGMDPKILKRKNSPSGMINPFDIWRESTKATVICAGEKDMAIARSFGFNAITITGGELSLPKLFAHSFKGRSVHIIYDNDDTGRTGASNLAVFLKPYVKKLKIIDLSEVCVNKGEDLWDYFIKYHKTKEDLIELIKSSPEFGDGEYQIAKEKIYPTVSLMDAGTPQHMGKVVRSNIQVIGVVEEQFQLPSSLTGIKYKTSDTDSSKDTMLKGDKKEWFLDQHNIKDMLYLIDSKLKEHQIYVSKLELLGIPKKEQYIEIKEESKETVYKCFVADLITPDMEQQRTEFLAYSLNEKLENGKKYMITYKLVPHPFDGQKLIMIILDAEGANDTINNFSLSQHRINILKNFQVTTTLENRIHQNVEMVRGMVNAKYNKELVLLVDLWYHSVLKFDLGAWKDNRGALDVLLVGESRTGKSSTAETLAKRYRVGEVIPMPTTTKAGLIGGSNKSSSGSYQTRAGLLPMNHGGAVILEELGKARDRDIIKELTEIKSSGLATINRVNGSLSLPCVVRMLSITNTKTVGEVSKPISSYPNGISVITDLIGAAEDIARFDIAAVFSFMANEDIDPFAEYVEPYPDEWYQTRVAWVWSRRPDQIIFTKEVYEYIVQISNAIKTKYDSYLKIFGTETWKKIARLAIALAGYTVSTDESFENIIITKEHVTYASEFMVSLYDNPVFRFKEYVEEERRLRDIDEEGVRALQNFYKINPTLIIHLENVSETSRNNMAAISGMANDEFTRYINGLVSQNFITFQGFSIHPTERFRKGMRRIDRKTMKIKPIGGILYDDNVV
jgi:hypothetical protein